MLVATPRMRNSARARRARRTAVGKSRPRQVSLTSIESKCGADLGARRRRCRRRAGRPRRRPSGRSVIRPVSGRNPLAGSSVVIRHCSAAPRTGWSSWREPEVGQRLARGDPQLRADEVDVGDLLGDRVLDLDARVHLDEDVAPVGVEQELDGARVDVADLPGERDGVGADPLAQLGVEVGRGRDLDDLLVAPLHRAVALVEVDDVARRRRRGSAPRCGAG